MAPPPDRTEQDGSESNRSASERDQREGGTRARLAEERTDWALERTLLAKQRTFGAWMRTGMASVVLGVGAARLLTDLGPAWVLQGASGLLLAVGMATFWFGFQGYRRVFRKLSDEGVRGTSLRVAGTIAVSLTAATLILFVLILLE